MMIKNINEGAMDRILIQEQDFDQSYEYQQLTNNSPKTGAVVCFTGRVREFGEQRNVTGLVIEHYPGMTELSFEKIIALARERWSLQRITIIHRIGELSLEEQIVFVGVSSAHRESAFDACRFIMDYLKTEAPFWKKEKTDKGEIWVEAQAKDQKARDQWQPSRDS